MWFIAFRLYFTFLLHKRDFHSMRMQYVTVWIVFKMLKSYFEKFISTWRWEYLTPIKLLFCQLTHFLTLNLAVPPQFRADYLSLVFISEICILQAAEETARCPIWPYNYYSCLLPYRCKVSAHLVVIMGAPQTNLSLWHFKLIYFCMQT